MFNLFGGNSFLDLLGKPSFWFTMAIIVGVIVVIVFSIKNPRIGGPVLISLFSVAMVVMAIYSGIQLNYYYNTKGGIYGAITGIFNTNEVEVVDDLTFKLKNIELLETSEGLYSASITTEEVLSLDTRGNLGVFVNGMPCDTTSEVHSDYAIAHYTYSFYDVDKTLLCTDTLTLNFAFYNDSTYLSLSTKGGTLPVEDSIKYWHYYFNKNGFEVKIAPFNSFDEDMTYVNGNISNYAIVNYYVNNEFYTSDCVVKGKTLTLLSLDSTEFLGWYTAEDSLVYETITLNNNLNLYAKFKEAEIPVTTYVVSFNVDNEITRCVFNEGQTLQLPEEPDKYGYKFLGWSKDGVTVFDTVNYVVTENIELFAVFEELPKHTMTFVVGEESTTYTAYEGETFVAPENPTREGQEFYGWSLDGYNIVDVKTEDITEDITYTALFGYYEETYVYYRFVNEGVVYTQNLKEWFVEEMGYYSVDLTKSIIPVNLCCYAYGMVSGKDYKVLTLNSSTIDKVITLDSANIKVPECTDSGTMTIKVASDGTVTIDLNNFKISSSAKNILLTTQADSTIYVITK